MTKAESNADIDAIWKARTISDEEVINNNVYNIIPKTLKGKLSLMVLVSGLVLFLIGVFMGSTGSQIASYLAIGGMVIYFIGGLFKTYTN
jgi:hypothetical protein